MDADAFRARAETAWQAIPPRFADRLRNVALLLEDEPDEHTRTEEGLANGETLLGLYRGIPLTERGSEYGVGGTLPDTITLYRLPILEAAGNDPGAVQREIEDTIWHEVAHYFGFDEEHVHDREQDGTNSYPSP